MFRSKLIAFLNEHVWLQYIFVILPVVTVAIYSYAYMTDMLSISRSLAYNDSISERSFDEGTLKKVVYSEVNDAGVTEVVVDGGVISDENVKVDDVIFYVQMYNVNWFQIVSGSGSAAMTEHCSLFDVKDETETGAVVTYEDFEHEFSFGDLVCAVTVSPDGLWRVTFLTDEAPHYDLEELSMVELLSSEGGRYSVRVYNRYTTEVDDMELNFCSNLPSEDTYFDESTGSFVKNISKDYAETFILRSNILIVLVTLIWYFLLLYDFIAKESKLSLVQNVYLRRANAFAVCLLPVCIVVTSIML